MRTQRGPGHHRMGLKPLPGSKARLRSVTATAQSFHGPLELTRRLERRQEGRGVPEPCPPSPLRASRKHLPAALPDQSTHCDASLASQGTDGHGLPPSAQSAGV